jgi:prepilin-type N-terminal cleavage/methylation domain-containing protein
MSQPKWRGQSGMTLIELLIGMAVTSFVLLGLSGVVTVSYRVMDLWSQRIDESQTVDQLASWLQQDTHRYVVCGNDGTTLQLCVPNSADQPVVTYASTCTGGSCDLTRQDGAGGSRVVGRGLASQPTFDMDCTQSANVDTGHLTVSNLTYLSAGSTSQAPLRSGLSLYFRAPTGAC